ncbi:MAG: hypothetical protein IJ819_07815 [Clostridiales bacterium]|nr:hypothetical protein [Clostridiales bacterium]
MLAILYLCVCAITGMVLVAICVPDVRRLYLACAPSVKAIENIPSTLFVVAAGTISGMMLVPFVNYYVILGLTYFVASDKLCMKIGFMVTAALFFWLVLTCLIVFNRRRIKRDEEETADFVKLPGYVNKPSNTIFYSVIILLTAVVSAFLMFYTYRIDHGSLINGYSTFSDLSPHTAMVSSFGKGFNFPTQYMHFSGDGIKYHFLFYFLAGMLEYLGFPIDYALNIPSILAMVCAMILLGLLASLLSGRRLAFALSPVLVFLRSSLNVFIHIRNLVADGETIPGAIGLIMQESAWYEATPYDNWGIWAINVYPNQRHLMLGVAVILLCIILFIPFVRRLCISVMSAGSFGGVFKAILFSRNAWLPRKNDPLSGGTVALFTCLLMIAMPYFHGSCLIALLLVLFGMALVSESRLLHLMVAVCAVCSSYIQTLALSGGASNVINLKFAPGFLFSEDTTVINANTLLQWGQYLITVTGATLILAILCNVILLFHDIIKKKPVYRFFLMLAFLNPLIFAFMFQVTLEMLANHKFIQVTLILADAFVAIFLANLFIVPGRRKAEVALAADADIAENEDEDEKDEKPAADAEKLEANIEKAEKEGELAPVIVDKEKESEEDGSDDEPFEVLTDPEETPDEKSEKTGDDKPEETAKDPGAEDTKEDSVSSDEAKTESDDRVLEKFPSEKTVSMRPGNIVNSEKEDEEKDEVPAEEASEVKEEPKTSDESDESFPKEDTVALRPGNVVSSEKEEDKKESSDKDEETAKEETESSDASETKEETKSEASEDEDSDEPFEVLDDDDDSKSEKSEDSEKSEEKSLTETKDAGEAKETSDDKSAKEVSEEVKDEEEDADNSDMVLEHEEIPSDKNKGMPVAVWAVFEIFGVLAALILLVGLVGTGISEWATYININSTPMAVNTNSAVSDWIIKNTEPGDVFLTPEWSMNRFLLTGRAMYYGWPYYAWSAGHDTNTRDKIYVWLITGCGGDINEFKRYCKERGIRYLIADPEFEDGDYGEGVYFNRAFFEQNLQQVAYFTEENTVIYKIY